MIFPRPFSIALSALCFFLSSSFTVEAAEGSYPDFIQDWKLWQDYDQFFGERGDLIVPKQTGVVIGNWDPEKLMAAWDCYSLQLKVGQEIAAGDSVIEKAELDPYPDQFVVVKRSASQKEQLIFGARLQERLDNPNILPVIGMFTVPGFTPPGKMRSREWSFVIMPYVETGSLESNYDSYTDQAAINGAFKQMLNAVAAVSAAGFIHRDLKPENFLKDGDTLKLMDFDQTREASMPDVGKEYDVGTPSYTAPEIVSMKTDVKGVFEYTTKVDTFSIAMSFMVMSVPDLRDSDKRFQLWKDLIEPEPKKFWPSAKDVEEILRKRNYAVFQGNDGLLQVLAKALCTPGERYDPPEFLSAFSGVA
ncbi:hypothetical protein F66182_6050 [Fusarium sp. NRRL 66182]|nr:hypothetical protein F66182_6050 [Fusarium sp. NRRL 66182]